MFLMTLVLIQLGTLPLLETISENIVLLYGTDLPSSFTSLFSENIHQNQIIITYLAQTSRKMSTHNNVDITLCQMSTLLIDRDKYSDRFYEAVFFFSSGVNAPKPIFSGCAMVFKICNSSKPTKN